VNLAIQNEREWLRFCETALQQPDMANDPKFKTNSGRVENRELLHTLIREVFAVLSAAEIIDRLDQAGIANARMNSLHDFWQHPQLASRNRWREVGSPVGEIKALITPVTVPEFDVRMDPIPGVGQHTEAILRELGYDDASINRMRAQGVV
jgi:itaconate CoA-transferase